MNIRCKYCHTVGNYIFADLTLEGIQCKRCGMLVNYRTQTYHGVGKCVVCEREGFVDPDTCEEQLKAELGGFNGL